MIENALNRSKNDLIRDTVDDVTNFSGIMIGTKKNVLQFKSVTISRMITTTVRAAISKYYLLPRSISIPVWYTAVSSMLLYQHISSKAWNERSKSR
jgi:hypothetical protein